MAVRSTNGNSLFFATGLDNSGLRKGTFDALGMIQAFAGKVANINPFVALAAAAVAAFATISAEAYDLAKKYEHAMKEVSTISDAAQKDFEGISKKVFKVSEISPDDPVKLAKAYYQIVSAGYDGAKGLNVLEISAKAATAGVTETEVAADGLTTVMNAWSIDASKSESIADTFFTTVKLGKTTFDELAKSISEVAPIAAASNIPINEVFAAIASITSQGTPTSVAMTQVKSAILGMQEAGRLDGTKTLQKNMQDLYNTFKGDGAAIRKEVGRVEALNAVLALSGKKAKDANEDLLAYKNTIGATEKANEEMLSSTENQWAILRNRIKGLTLDIGNSLLAMTNSFAKGVNSMFESGKKLEESYDEQRAKLYRLRGELENVNNDSEERIKIIKQIVSEYPAYLNHINIETVTNNELLKILDKVNIAYKERYKLEKRAQELRGEQEKQGDIEMSIEDADSKWKESIARIRAVASSENIELEVDFSLPKDKLYSSIYNQLKEVPNALDNRDNTNSRFTYEGNAEKYLGVMRKIFLEEKNLNDELKNQIKIVDKLKVEHDNLNKVFLNSAQGFNEVVSQIKRVTKFSELDEFESFLTNPAAIKQIEIKREELKELSELSSIAKDDYRKDNNILKSFLESENSIIAEAAKKRLAIFQSGSQVGDGNSFDDILRKKKEQYHAYSLALASNDEELASKLKKNYSLKEADYVAYLRRQYELATDHKKKIEILNELDSFKKTSGRDKVNRIEVEKKTIDSIVQLNREGAKEVSQTNRDNIEEEIQLNKDLLSGKTNMYFNSLKEYKDFWKQRLEIAKQAGEDIEQIEGKLGELKLEQFISSTGQISTILNDISNIFSKFGDEDTSQLLQQLSGMANGISQIAQGFATGNPLDIIGGSIATLDSALTVEVSSDTEKFEKAIKQLEKTIEQLDYVISKSIGEEKITSRKEAIADLEELEKQANKAHQAEQDARKEIKLLGMSVGKKGKGSGTSADKLEELADKAEEARRRAEELRKELDEIFTGTTHQTIVDSILQGFKEGKSTIKDFASTFEDLMKGALLESFKMKYLENQLSNWFDMFSAYSGDNDGLTPTEIKHLSGLLNTTLSDAQAGLEEMNNVLNDAGLGDLGSGSKPGLAGAISTISEDTANVLAGTLNSIRIDVANGLAIAEQSSNYLSQIAQNTSYNHYLESMDSRLANIEDLL